MENGWIRLHRKIQTNPLYFSEKFTKTQAWIDLLILANHAPGYITTRNGELVLIERGQVGYSLLNLGKRWKWSKGKVWNYIKLLTVLRQIETQKTNVTIITVMNYEAYQPETDPQTSPQTDRKPATNNKNKKKEKKEEKEKIYKKEKFLDFVLLTTTEHEKLIDRFGVETTDNYIERLNNYIGSKGTRYKSHYHTILNWSGKDAPPPQDAKAKELEKWKEQY